MSFKGYDGANRRRSVRFQVTRSTCLARLERRSAGEFGNEAGGALGAGGGKRSEDLPGTGASLGFITAGDFACDHRGAKLAFGQIVSSLDAIAIQKVKEMIALFMEPIAHGLFIGFATGKLQ